MARRWTPHLGARQSLALVLTLGLSLTVFATVLTDRSVAQSMSVRLDGDMAAVVASVRDTMTEPRTATAGGVGLFAASKSVERDEWKKFFAALPDTTRANIELFSFVRVVPADGLAAFVEATRNDTSVRPEGYPDFVVAPRPGATDSFIVDYVEPADALDPAMGFDLEGVPVIYDAALRARDEGTLITSAPYVPAHDEPHLFLLQAIYRNGAPVSNVAERRAALFGFALAGVPASAPFSGIVTPTGVGHELAVVDLGDTEGVEADRRAHSIYQSHEGDPLAHATAAQERVEVIEIGGRLWRIAYSPGPGFTSAVTPYIPWFTFGFGAALSVFLALTILSLQGSRARAQRLADAMTAELRDSENRFRTLAQATSEAIVIHSEGRIIESNDAAVAMLGAPLVGRRVLDFVAPEDQDRVRTNIQQGESRPYQAKSARP